MSYPFVCNFFYMCFIQIPSSLVATGQLDSPGPAPLACEIASRTHILALIKKLDFGTYIMRDSSVWIFVP